MKCPYCGKEMEQGYIQSRDGLGWSKKDRMLKVFAGLLAEIPFGNSVDAWRCADCKKIVIDEKRKWENRR